MQRLGVECTVSSREFNTGELGLEDDMSASGEPEAEAALDDSR